jgi:hypothetical protein
MPLLSQPFRRTLSRSGSLLAPCLLAALFLGADAPPPSAPAPPTASLAATNPETASTKDAVLQNRTMRLRFHADEKGLRLVSLVNLTTGKEYLRPTYDPAAEPLPPPSLWEGRAKDVAAPPEKLPPGSGSTDASAVGNPFYISTQREGKTRIFNAATDFDVVSWSATPASLTARLRGRGIFLDATLRVLLAQDHTYWNLRLHSFSGDPLDATVGFPAFARLIVTGPRQDRIYLPWGSGGVLRDPARQRRRLEYGPDLSSVYAIWQGDGEGLYLADNNRDDLNTVSLESDARRAIQVGPPTGVPDDTGPSLALAETIRIGKGSEVAVGPVMVGTYRGNWRAGASEVRRLHGVMYSMRRSRLGSAATIARLSGSLSGGPETVGRGWNVLLLSDFSSPLLGDYTTIPANLGGTEGLKKAVAAVRQAGGKVLFVLDGSHASKDSIVGRASGEKWAVRRADQTPLEENGNWVMCPSNYRWRQWLADMAVRLLRFYKADGIALAGLSDAPASPCYSADHGHASPYSWTWAVQQTFADVRAAMDKEFPDSLLLSVGALDLARGSADGMVAETPAKTGGRFEAPALKAVFPAIRVYESPYDSDPAQTERQLAWNLSQGLPLYASAPEAAEKIAPPKRLLAAFAGLIDSAYYPTPPVASSRDVNGEIFVGSPYFLGLSAVGEENYVGDVQLPFRAQALEDPLSGLRIEPKAPGLFPLALPPHQAFLWKIVP